MEIKNEILGTQFLSFSLREEHFAIEIFKVREVLDVTTLTRIPRMPNYMCGVINLRGKVVPVIDLGLKLGMEPVMHTVNSCIMIVEVKEEGEADKIQMGVVTDAVEEVIYLTKDEIEPTPDMGSNLNTEFIKGMGRKGEKFLILLDIDKILSAEGETVMDHFRLGNTQEMGQPPEAVVETVPDGA